MSDRLQEIHRQLAAGITDYTDVEVRSLLEQIDSRNQQIALLVDTLKTYGRHEPGCASYKGFDRKGSRVQEFRDEDACDCGFSGAIDSAIESGS